MAGRTYLGGGNGQLDRLSKSNLVLRSHRQRVVRVGLQVFNANATICRVDQTNTRQHTDRLSDETSRTNNTVRYSVMNKLNVN